MALTKYDNQHVTQKAIKWSVMSDYLAHQPLEDYQSMRFEFPDDDIMLIRDCNIHDPEEGLEPRSRWTIVFDGASNAHGNGIGELITSPTGFHLSFTARLFFDRTNTMATYEAYIFGIEAAIGIRISLGHQPSRRRMGSSRSQVNPLQETCPKDDPVLQRDYLSSYSSRGK